VNFKIGDLIQFSAGTTHLWVIDSIDYDTGEAYLTDMNDGVTSQFMFISFLNSFGTVVESGVGVPQQPPTPGSPQTTATNTPATTSTSTPVVVATGTGCLLKLLTFGLW
jgi:hypothetical protein